MNDHKKSSTDDDDDAISTTTHRTFPDDDYRWNSNYSYKSTESSSNDSVQRKKEPARPG